MKTIRIAAVGVLALVAAPALTADAKPAPGPLRDGDWAGTIVSGATVDFSKGTLGLIAEASGAGTFDLILGGGTADGSFQFHGLSDGSLAGDGATGQVTADVTVDGTLEGTASIPILQPQQGHAEIVGNVSVNGYAVPVDEALDFGPGDMLSSNLVITAASCTYASGTWAQEVKTAIAAAGGQVTKFEGSWAATYAGGAVATADAALTDLLNRGEALMSTWLAGGTFDDDAMENVLVHAEHYAAAGPTNDKCGTYKGEWASPLAGLVQRLLTAVATSPSTTAEALRFGIAAGLRVGELPSFDGDTLEDTLHGKAQELLDLAISSGAKSDMSLIAVSADSLGWSDIATQAAQALGASK